MTVNLQGKTWHSLPQLQVPVQLLEASCYRFNHCPLWPHRLAHTSSSTSRQRTTATCLRQLIILRRRARRLCQMFPFHHLGPLCKLKCASCFHSRPRGSMTHKPTGYGLMLDHGPPCRVDGSLRSTVYRMYRLPARRAKLPQQQLLPCLHR